jgi:hypothetical protein
VPWYPIFMLFAPVTYDAEAFQFHEAAVLVPKS